jgi:hypothetical protein
MNFYPATMKFEMAAREVDADEIEDATRRERIEAQPKDSEDLFG